MADFNTSLYVAFPLVTIFWLIVAVAGFVVPCFIPRNKNRGVIGVMIVLTAICCYVFWLIAFLAQLYPMFGPDLENGAAAHIRKAWSGFTDVDNTLKPCYPNW